METEILDQRESTASQNYATHGFFRFYGKLPPLVVRELIKEAEEPILDIMCGSGTVLVEGSIAHKQSVGIDVNPLCVMISKVKTTPLERQAILNTLSQLETRLLSKNPVSTGQYHIEAFQGATTGEDEYLAPNTKMIDRWFKQKAIKDLAAIKAAIQSVRNPEHKAFFLVAFAGIVRKGSIASPRAGKLFRVPDKPEEDIVEAFLRRARRMAESMPEFAEQTGGEKLADVIRADSRSAPIRGDSVPFVFWHPPYFALYRYSAIYSLEMDWLGIDRRIVRGGEIEEGYKTSDISKFDSYLFDLRSTLSEARRLLRRGGVCCAVVADSSLRETKLPVVQAFEKMAVKVGFDVERKVVRKIHFAQASYHPSSTLRVRRNEDVAVYLRKK